MESALLTALVHSPDLSPGQLRGVIDVVAETSPPLLRELADRDDLDADLRADLIRAAPEYLIVNLLKRWPPDQSLVTIAADVHGATPDLVLLCGAQGWLDQAIDLAPRTPAAMTEAVVERWEATTGQPVPDELITALVHAVLSDRPARPKLSELPKWEQDQALKRLEHEERTRHARVWQLIDGKPNLWLDLAHDPDHARELRWILLGCPDELTDDVLLACLPEVTADHLRDRDSELFAGIRMSTAAEHSRKWPRLRDLAANELQRVVREALEDGWTPTRHALPGWTEIAALAELTEDPALLSEAVAAIRDASIPEYMARDRDWVTSWQRGQAEAADALAMNPHTPHTELIAMIPALSEAALLAILEHGNGDLHTACQQQLDQLHRHNAERQPTIIHVPTDEELARTGDPVRELSKHLPHLRTRAAQRDATTAGILRSRYTTIELLRELRAHHVLDSADQAEQVARAITETCGDHRGRWNTFAQHLVTPPGKTVTFGAWLDLLATARALSVRLM